jgi:transcriptional regulator with XRE-family HTH domain
MKMSEQLRARRVQAGKTQQQLHDVTGIAASNVSNILKGNVEARAGTLEALADALDSRWMLVPKHLIPEVERLLSGKAIGPDESLSTVDQLFAGGRNE